MKKQGLGTAALAVAAAMGLAACGGGEGSPGETQEQYHIALEAQKTSLPLNIGNVGPGMGAYAPYTTSLTVSAVQGRRDRPVPESTPFSCNLTSGPDTGALYYLDGEHDGEGGGAVGTEVQGYRAIVLESNAGAATFHFHAGTQAGTADIKCSVTDPRDGQSYTVSTRITVGGTTGLPAGIWVEDVTPEYLGTEGNENNIHDRVSVQLSVRDDANLIVPDPSAANVLVEITENGNGGEGALLSSAAGQSAGLGDGPIELATQHGVAQFSLYSGSETGSIVLRLSTDRADNDVANGLQNEIARLMSVPVVASISGPLTVEELKVSAKREAAVVLVLEATGGVPPYKWEVVTKNDKLFDDKVLKWNEGDSWVTGVVPNGFTLGDYAIEVTVTDRDRHQASGVVVLTVEE